MKNVAFKPVLCKRTVTVLLAMACLFLNGCGKPSSDYSKAMEELSEQPPNTDVTKDPRYYFLSFAGTIWRTKTQTAIIKAKLYTGEQAIALVPRDAFDRTDPKYRPAPGMQLVTVVPSGALVRIDRLLQDNGIGSPVYVIASLDYETNCQTTNLYLDAEFLANNSFFRGPATLHRWGVNSNLLEAVTNAP
ncbi:MAG TPA: hypothetical protein VNV43_07145 [Candidatus Acidoferrales bacterium]|jgi:hypothetical protein|nr:hypothetical protein [Candidatus Acidoferrales bacterium]